MATVAGIDGCKMGWICVYRDLDSGKTNARILKSIWELSAIQPAPTHVMIDIPIGLPDAGARACDTVVRKMLGPKRGSSVFPAPLRPTLAARNYQQACEIRMQIEGKKLSKQTYMLFPKINEVDEFIRADSRRQDWFQETHPELCFYHLNGGRPIVEGKRTPQGEAIRTQRIRAQFGDALDKISREFPRTQCATDDILDAFAALWTAERALQGTAIALPPTPERDACGLRMEMLA